MLYDYNFLRQLDENRTKTIYARIIALQLDESPIETIEGRVTQGSINLDGDSAVRRTCSLTIIAKDYDYNNYLWGLNTKFKLEIGLENNIDSTYPSIIWFKQGTYFISSFNTSRSTNNFTITIQGKDKMCGLNGEIGGTFTSSVDVGTMEEIDKDGKKRIIHLPIKDIIRNVVQLYGGEPAHNIIINDLDMYGLELLEYRYDEPMYLYRDAVDSSDFVNITLDGDKPCSVEGDKSVTKLSKLKPEHLDLLITPMTGTSSPKIVTIDNENYYVAKVSYGETAGYRYTDLTYPGDLIANIGETIMSILDKIKNMLGEFEYFYNLDGQFVFQKKKIYADTRWNPEMVDSDGRSYVSDSSEIAYTFNNGVLITAFNNNPNLQNLRNDFSVWGERVGVSGAAIPVHMRYAIDKKPTQYNRIKVDDNNQNLIDYNKQYGTTVKGQKEASYFINDYDWREIIYRMAQDYYKYAHILDDFEQRLVNANPEFTSGKTGYENYYIDLITYWRELYNPEITSDTNYYHEGPYINWNKTVYEHPENLNFWFDFLDSEGELSQYSVKNVGCRPKAINDSNVKSIYFRETPNILFIKDGDKKEATGYTYINISPAYVNTMFSISAQGRSAKNKIDELLYAHSYCIESATITSIPIYYLEPNVKVRIIDEETNLDGYYKISKLSIPLSYNGTMSITATKVAQNI